MKLEMHVSPGPREDGLTDGHQQGVRSQGPGDGGEGSQHHPGDSRLGVPRAEVNPGDTRKLLNHARRAGATAAANGPLSCFLHDQQIRAPAIP